MSAVGVPPCPLAETSSRSSRVANARASASKEPANLSGMCLNGLTIREAVVERREAELRSRCDEDLADQRVGVGDRGPIQRKLRECRLGLGNVDEREMGPELVEDPGTRGTTSPAGSRLRVVVEVLAD